MKAKLITLALALVLLASLSVPAYATSEVEAALAAAQWLKAQRPEAGVGDEAVVLALLRGEYLSAGEEYTQLFVLRLLEYWDSGEGSVEQAIHQGLALAAAGISLDAYAPKLLSLLNSTDFSAQPFATRCEYLLFCRATGQPLDAQMADALLSGIIAEQEQDGSFGNAENTALALQAMAGHYNISGVENASLNAQIWLQLNDNGQGSYGNTSASEVSANARVILAIDCLGFDPAYADPEGMSIVQSLLQLKQANGSFGSLEETALALLALTAKNRYNKSMASVYNFSDVAETQPNFSLLPGESPAPGASTGPTQTEGDASLGEASGAPSSSASGEPDGMETPSAAETGGSGLFIVVLVITLLVLAAFVFVILHLLKAARRK